MNNRKMKVYKNVVVERIHTNLTFPETVPCYANFDYSNPIGVAILYPERRIYPSLGEKTINADICLFEDKWSTPNHWPILGIRYENEMEVNGTVMCLAISNRANADKMINPLSELNDPDFRIIPKDTPLEWGSMGFGFPITSPNQWPSPNHTGNEKPIGRYVDGEIVLNDNTLCQCIIPEYLPNEHGDMTCIKCGHYPNPINPFANIL